MFQNIPPWLEERVREIAPADKNEVYARASGWVISWYLRKDVSLPDEDEFFDHPGTDNSYVKWNDHINRIILIAETIFLLRNSPGFEEFRRRLVKRPLRAAFFEMLAAKQFFKRGFEIFAKPEEGKRGCDFDFTAVRDGESINVEVTALTAQTFSENTIRNALGHKRKQMPNNAPAIIYCAMPERWFVNPENWNVRLPEVIQRFFGPSGTRRINAVVFWAEKHLAVGDSGSAVILVSAPFVNLTPRIPLRDNQFLLLGRSLESGIAAVEHGVNREQIVAESESSEFFKWVDSIIKCQDAR